MARIHDTILDAIGNTPLVRAPRFSEDLAAEIVFKLESFNPLSSVKDRPAVAMIDDALASGRLAPGGTIIEATSGNTGIGLALAATVRGVSLLVTMPESMSIERRKILTALGAEVILTPAAEGMRGAVAKAEALRDEIPGSLILGQFDNPANPEIHRRTTAREIWEDSGGEVDLFVAGVGTGGTITGVARGLKDRKPQVRVVAVEPQASPVISGGPPGPHRIQGIGAGFVPQNLDVYLLDEIVTVRDEDAFRTARQLCRHDGLMVGISSGAVAWACRELARKAEYRGQMIVGLLASHGERYLSTPLYD
ncbi:MAG: cysteine synthase A [Candidatus Eisenbacteria bacterium]|nr:cysteine synthase A [Candidatus Eisenbacteria bacterium]